MPEVTLTFETWTIIEDELPDIVDRHSADAAWLRFALTDPAAVVCNAPRLVTVEEPFCDHVRRGAVALTGLNRF